MFSSKKKTKTKEISEVKNTNKHSSKSFSKQIISLMGRKKNSDSDTVSNVTSVDSNTDASVASSPFVEPIVGDVTIGNLNIDTNGDVDVSDDELTYPNWYKQTLSLPVCGPYCLEAPLSLNISRSPKGDFGFVLRKGNYVERYVNESGLFVEIKHQIIFSEPLQMNRESLLLPGDVLIEVNGVNVQAKTREEIIAIVKSCGSEVILTIEPAPECLEFSFRRYTSLSTNFLDIRKWMNEKKCYSGIYNELHNKIVNNFESIKNANLISKHNSQKMITSNEYSKSEHVWINFNEGFASGYIVKKLNDDKCMVKLTDNNSEIEVSEEDIHLANSAVYDLEENLITLPHINESSVLYDIRQRFCTNLIHTYVGKNILYLNPMNNLNCFSDKVMHLFKFGYPEDLPPHVYSIAQNTFENLKVTKENQSICILGRSGSGKSTVLMNLVNYFTYTTTISSNKTNVTNEKIQALWVLLDAFTCTKTGITTNASRCGKIISLNMSNLNHNLVLTGLNLQIFLLDRNRLIRRPDGEPTFHIFYCFLASPNSKQVQAYNLQFINEPNAFMRPLQRDSEIELAKEKWDLIHQAAVILGISEIEWDVICRLLASVFHLGSAKTTTYKQNGQICGKFLNKEASKRAANTLNCSEEALNRAIFEYFKDELTENDKDCSESSSLKYNSSDLLNGFVSGIYLEIIEMIVFFINRCFNVNHYRVMHTITIFDPPGFQVTSNLNKNHSGSYEDLLYNYAYERLIDLNIKQNITKQANLYNQENINLDFLNDLPTCNNILTLLDGDCKSDKFDTLGKQGILNFIESEAIAGNESTLIKKMCTLFSNHHSKVPDKKKRVLKYCSKTGDFTIGHCNLSQSLKYNVKGWLKNCRELPTIRSSAALLSMCHNDVIQDILTSLSHKGQNAAFDLKYYAKKSVLAQTKLEMDHIINVLSQTEHLSFIYCVSPIPNAGLSRLKESLSQQAFEENIASGGFFSVPFVKMQLQTFHTLTILRSLKFGFPEYLNFQSFINTIRNVIPTNELPNDTNLDGNSMLRLLNYLKIKPSRYRIGTNKIFFRMGTVFDLKNSKELAATNFIVKFQSICKRYLAIKKVEKMKMESDATRIIQRNCLAYSRMKEWSWWKLFSQIRPLITILRTDEELKYAKHNAEIIQQKYRDLEIERNNLKSETRRLEELLDEMKNEQVLHRQKLQQMTEILQDKETNEILLKNKIEELNDEMAISMEKIQQLERDTSKNSNLSNLNGDKNSDIIIEENIAPQFNEDVYYEPLQQSKREYEEAQIELQKSQKMCDNLKMVLTDYKYQMDNLMTKEDIADMHQQLENENSRLKTIIGDQSRCLEQMQRDWDITKGQKLSLDQRYQELKEDSDRNAAKISALDNVDFGESDFLDEREMLYRKKKVEYEQRIRDLQEEVDEMSDNYDTSQQERLKLQVQIERLNHEKNNDELERDSEIENLKASNARKVKNLELLLEEDRDKRQSLLKDKKDNERLISDLRQQLEIQRDIGMERKLKKELRATKDQLNEALDQIDELKCRREDKTDLKDLRERLDEAEHSRDIILKQSMSKERDLEEAHMELENLTKVKIDLEDKLKNLKSEVLNLQSQNEDFEEEIKDFDRKHKQLQSQHLTSTSENNVLREKVDCLEDDLQKSFTKLGNLERELLSASVEQIDKSELIRLQTRVKDLENKLQYEESLKNRFQTTNERLKEQLFKAQSEKESFESKEKIEQEKAKKLQKQFKEAKNDIENQSCEINENSKKIKMLHETINNLQDDIDIKNREVSQLQQNVQRLELLLNEDDDSDHSFSEVLERADNLIKKRKFSMDQSTISHLPSVSNRRNSIATERLSTTFDDDNEY